MQDENSEILKNFSSRLRLLMDKKRIKGKHVAEACGVKSPTVTGWRNGEYLPDNRKQLKLAELLGVNVDYLVFGRTENKLGSTENDDRELSIVREETPAYLKSDDSIEKECRNHFETFIRRAKRHPGALGWTLVTLQDALPINKWIADDELTTKEKIIEEFRRNDPNPGILDEPLVKKHLDEAKIEKPEDMAHVFAAAAIEYGKESSKRWMESKQISDDLRQKREANSKQN